MSAASRLRPAHAALVAILLVLVALSVPRAAQEAPYSAHDDGPRGTGHLLASQGTAYTLGGTATPVELRHGALAGLDPENHALLVVAPRLAYSDGEVAAVRDFIEQGGRVLVADLEGSGRVLVEDLGIGLRVPTARVFSTSYAERVDQPMAESTGVLSRMPAHVPLDRPGAVLGAGEPVLQAHPYSWLDTDQDGRPDLDEPRGAWAYARHLQVGAGAIVVLAAPELFLAAGHEAARDSFLDWLHEGHRTVLMDEGHRARGDPIGVAGLLAGQEPVRAVLLLAAVAAAAALVAFQPRLRRLRPRRRRRPTPRDAVRQAALDELPP